MPTVYTIQEIIDQGKMSVSFALNYKSKMNKFGGTVMKQKSPQVIQMVTDALDWGYEGSPSESYRGMANYLVWLMDMFGLNAINQMSGGGGGTVIPIPVSSSGQFPIVIDSSYFVTATEYNDTRIVGKNLTLDIKEIPTTLIQGVDFAVTLTGVQILFAGFDATVNDYHIRIWEAFTGQNPSGGGGSLLISTYYGDTDYYSDLIANNDIVPYNGSASGTQGSPMTILFPSAASDPSGKYLVFKIASTQTDKSTWENTGTLNTGNIPDSVFRELISFGGYDYYCTRIAYVFDPSFLTMVLT